MNTAPFNNSVLVMPVPIGALGLPAGQTSFRYRVVGSSRFWGTIDTTPWANYNHAQPGVAFSDGLAATPMYPDLAGQQIGVTFNQAAFTANGSQGVLLLHHFNRRGAGSRCSASSASGVAERSRTFKRRGPARAGPSLAVGGRRKNPPDFRACDYAIGLGSAVGAGPP